MTVVIPTFNRADVLARALESALAQSVQPAEIVVVDDGSTDETARVVRGCGPSIVRYVRQDNSGGASARNRGVAEAGHDWIAFLDSDDVWTPDHLERMAEALAGTQQRANFYFSDVLMDGAGFRGSMWESSGFSLDTPWHLVESGTDWVMRSIQPMMLQATIVRRDAFIAVGGFWDLLPRRHDTHLFLKLGVDSPVCAVASIGCIMTSDGDPAVRLTEAFDSSSHLYAECTERLYTDVLRRFPRLSTTHRSELATRAARAHISLAKMSWRDGSPPRALRHFSRAAVLSPRLITTRTAEKIGKVIGIDRSA